MKKISQLMFAVCLIIIGICLIVFTGCSTKQIIHNQKSDCVAKGQTYIVVQDENYKVIGVKCIPRTELEEIK